MIEVKLILRVLVRSIKDLDLRNLAGELGEDHSRRFFSAVGVKVCRGAPVTGALPPEEDVIQSVVHKLQLNGAFPGLAIGSLHILVDCRAFAMCIRQRLRFVRGKLGHFLSRQLFRREFSRLGLRIGTHGFCG